MILSPTDARLALILMNQSEESCVRPGEMTAQQALELIQRLKSCAEESAK